MNASFYCPQCGALNPSQETTCFACGRSLSEPAPVTDARRLIRGRYWLVKQLGVGGFGAVYQAEDTSLGNRLVAVKEMSSRGHKPEEAQEATQAFQREALLLAGLAHPSLPRIYERFEEEGRWYLVMDFIEGETLEVYLNRQSGSLPVKEALGLALQLSEVLGYLHSRQPPIIFRDLKPSNIMRQPDGQIALVDFGIARFFKPGQSKDTIAFGSPGYAAPEQYGKAQTTPRSDVFSLGALLHQLLTGIDPSEKPFRFAPLTMPRPAGLSALIERMVDMDESQRPASMEIVRLDLERLLGERTFWQKDDALALTGAYISPARAATGAPLAQWPVAQPAGYNATPGQPWTTPQPASKKMGNKGLVIVLVVVLGLCVGLPVLAAIRTSSRINGVAINPPNTNGSYSHTPVDQSTDTPRPAGTTTTTPSGPGAPIYALAWSPDGRYLASGGADDKVQIWTVDSGQPDDTTFVTNAAPTTELAWSPDGRYLASVDDGVIDLWDTSTNAWYVKAYQPAAGISAFAWSPASDRLAVAFEDGTVHLVKVVTWVDRLLLRAQPGSTNVIAWSPDGNYIATGGTAKEVDVWESQTGLQVYHKKGYTTFIAALAWSPDGQHIASADMAGDMFVWDALTGNEYVVYSSNTPGVNAVAWSPDSKYIASGDQSGRVEVWAPSHQTPVYTYTGHSGPVRSVAWSPDGQRIASASMDSTVQIWDALTGQNAVTYQQP